ncbi:transglutaminase superfamily protein [Actinocorallia herbida]|uniref:Transglutaminase superfamily protein n=1 Tax=Actinocorallia herbida TaxID=58109 RepID=A0A3N1DBB8_9ACTN|nr:transglutaminase domain-containing protein [Actinocorallia herbida]ROO90812.1 transglutaminase superfamily protein [Actinocorallia herbida]
MATGAVLAAGLCFHSLFGAGALWTPATVVCVGTAFVCAAARRLPWWAAWPASGLLVVAVLWWAGDHPGRSAIALYRGWGALLDTTLPVPATAANLAVPLAVLWAGTAVTVRMTLRTRGRPTPLIPAFAVFALAMAYSSAEPGVNRVPAVCFTAAVIAFLFLRRPRRRPRARRARIATGLAVCAVLFVAVAAAGFLGGSRPHDLRAGRSVSLVVRDEANPLSRVSEWLLHGTELFDVEGTASGEPFRLAVFDAHDGLRWSTSASFLRTGSRIPARADVSGEPVERTIRLTGLRGRWLPSDGWPDRLSTPALVDPETGVLAMPDPVKEGFTYRVWTRRLGTPGEADKAALRELSLRPDHGVELPARLADLGEEAAANAPNPYDFAERLAELLSERCVFDDHARPGHSLGRLAAFCAGGEGGAGTSEQFATAYALIARAQGLRTRLVLGFTVPEKADALDGDHTVRSGDVLVWPEVGFPSVGWVAFSPTPAREGSGAGTTDAAPTPDTSPSDHQVDSPKGSPSPTVLPLPPEPPDIDPPVVAWTSSRLWLLVLGAFLLLAYPVTAAVMPWAAVFRARRAGPPQARITGAWLYAIRPLPRDPALTPTRTLAVAESAHLNSAPLAPLAALMDASLYLRYTPTSSDAGAAWSSALAFRRSTSWFRRFRPRELAFHVRLAVHPLRRAGALRHRASGRVSAGRRSFLGRAGSR